MLDQEHAHPRVVAKSSHLKRGHSEQPAIDEASYSDTDHPTTDIQRPRGWTEGEPWLWNGRTFDNFQSDADGSGDG